MIYAPATLFLLKRVAGRTYCIKKSGRPHLLHQKVRPCPGIGKKRKISRKLPERQDSISVMDEVAGMQGGKSEVRDLEGLMHYK